MERFYFEQTHYPFFEDPPAFDRIEEAFDETMWTDVPPENIVAMFDAINS